MAGGETIVAGAAASRVAWIEPWTEAVCTLGGGSALGGAAAREQANHDQADRWLSRLHAPTGLDLGADSPETIALAVLAEIQKCRTNSSGLPLREVRGVAVAVPQ